MSDRRHDLTEILRTHGGAPEHLPGFQAALAVGLDEADRDMGRAVGGAGWLRLREMLGRRRPRFALAGAVMAAVVAGVLLVGLPAGQRVVDRFFPGSEGQGPLFPGPEPAQAEVLQIAQEALRSAITITADASFERGDYGSDIRYTSATGHGVLAADRSWRDADNSLDGGFDMSYDASTGVEHVWGWSADPAGPSVDFFTEEYVGIPPGEPDASWLPVGDSLNDFWYPSVNPLFGAVARAATADPGAKAQTGTIDGRPVWIVTCPVVPNSPYEGCSEERMPPDDPLGYGSPGADYRLTISVDQQTGLPVRVQSWADDYLVAESRLTNLRVDEPQPDGIFTPGLPTAAAVESGDDGRLQLRIELDDTTKIVPLLFDAETVAPEDVRVSLPDTPGIREDSGFRRTSIDQVAAAIGRPALVPAWMPDGFQLGCAAVKQKQRPSPPSDATAQATAGTGVVILRYEAGFQAITVTTRQLDPRFTSEKSSIDLDPFIGDAWPGWTDSRTPIKVTAGALAGARGNVVIAPLTIPHLWAVKDGMLLTVAGDASAAELLAIAGSIEPWDAHAEPQSPAPQTTGD
jgi:hypothetical protein